MSLFETFPRIDEELDSRVPVWCVTPDEGCNLHRFFDTPAISPSGKYVAVFRMPFESQYPHPGAEGQVFVIDLETGEEILVGTSRGWEPHLGANVNWGSSDEELFFNDVLTGSWTPFAWRVNPLTGKRKRLRGCVYQASRDGKWLVSGNPTTMRRTQTGYGVVIPDELVARNVGPTDAGFTVSDAVSGEPTYTITIKQILTDCVPEFGLENPEQYEIYPFHCRFSPDSSRILLSVRWFPKDLKVRWNVVRQTSTLRFAWVVCDVDGNNLRRVIHPDIWVRGGHHATWFTDSRNTLMNLDVAHNGIFRISRVSADDGSIEVMNPTLKGSGHPSVFPDGRRVLTDAYLVESPTRREGTSPLRWLDTQTGEETRVASIPVAQPESDSVFRIDPHPAWDRSWRYVTFNAYLNDSRRVCVADMQTLL